MAGFLSLSTRGFTTTVLITGGGVTPAEGTRCPGEVPATAIVTTPAEVVDVSVPAISAEPPVGTSSPANAVPTTFQCLGAGGEEGLQHKQSKHSTTTRLDNSTRRRSHTWWIRLRSLSACVPPDNPEGPMARLLPTPRTIRGSCSCSPSLRLPSPLWQNRLNYSGSSALIIIYKDKMISNALQTEQLMGLSGHCPIQPRLHRIGVGYTHTR
jgi:hypothetical protein